MVQKCSLLRVLEIFFIEPTAIHFVREISKRIKLAPTSVRNHLKELLKEGLIKRKKARPFDGFVGNRESDDFILQKRAYNLCSLKGLSSLIVSACYPKLIVVYGSYSLGEDIENSDIDIFVLTKVKKEINLEGLEKKLKRGIHPILIEDLGKLDARLRKKIYNGIVLYGAF